MTNVRCAAIFLSVVVALWNITSGLHCEEVKDKKQFRETAKVIFSMGDDEKINALVIPHHDDGSFPRSGWTDCEVPDKEILKSYVNGLKKNQRVEGYYIVTYKETGRDTTTPILRYKGVLIELEPWEPPFLKQR